MREVRLVPGKNGETQNDDEDDIVILDDSGSSSSKKSKRKSKEVRFDSSLGERSKE